MARNWARRELAMPDPAHIVDAAKTGAEIAQTTVDGSVAAAGGAGTLVLGWFGWIVKRAFGVTIPRLSKDFKDALGEQRAEFREELRNARQDFKDEIKQDRADLRTSLEKLTTAIERMDNTLRTRQP